MKAWEFNAVAYDGAIYCNKPACLPKGITDESEGAHPIFATDECDYYPCCDTCGRVHDYVGLTDEGRRIEAMQEQRKARRELVESYEAELREVKGLLMRPDVQGVW